MLINRPRSCPFCGCDRIGIHFKRAARKEGFQAMCLGCKVGQLLPEQVRDFIRAEEAHRKNMGTTLKGLHL